MSRHTVAIIGTGTDPHNPTVEGFAMGYRHAEAFGNNDAADVVACADIVPENGEAFADALGIDDSNVFEEYDEMLRTVEPGIVTVAVPPAIHEMVVSDWARSGVVSAIHCEKPMADTWDAAQRMAQECWRHDVQLTFNRQRRFGKPFREAKRLIDDGEIGQLRRVETCWGDFFDTDAHIVDLTGMWNDDRAPEWVIAQLDYREEDLRFGMHQENQVFAQWQYENGVQGVLSTGEGSDLCDAGHRIAGTEGEIRIDSEETGNMLEIRRAGDAEWDAIDADGETMHEANAQDRQYGAEYQDRAIDEIVSALEEGRESELSARNGLNAAEIIFGGYESARRRGRVEFPLDVTGSPFEEMVESGDLTPAPAGDE